jgi:AsmA protein
MKKPIKRAVLIISGLIALVILALYLLPIVYKENIESKAKKEINKATRAQINFDRVSVSFFKDFPNITISLHDLNIIGENEFFGDTLADIKEAAVELGTWDLLFEKETELKSVHLKDAVFDIIVLKNGSANYDIFIEDRTAKNNSDSSSINLALDEIKITNGTIEYTDKLTNTYLSMEGFDHIGKGDFQKDIFDYSTETKVSKMTLHYDNIKYLKKKEVQLNMIMEMNLKENIFSFKENIIRINHFQIGLEGFIKMLKTGTEMDLKFAAKETEFKNILSLIPGVYMHDFKNIKTKGEIAFDGFVKGKYLDDSTDIIPAFHVNMKIKDAMFKIDTLPNPVENIQLDLVIDNKFGIIDSTIFDLKKFHLNMGKHPVDGRIKLEGINHCRIDADMIANLELSELEAIYPIKGIDLKGKMDFSLNAKGKYINEKKGLQQIPAFHLDMKLTNGKIKYDSLPAAFEDIQLHLLAENKNGELENTVVDFKSIHMDMGGNPIHGHARVEGYKNYFINADISANLDLADIEKIYPIKNLTLKGMFDLDVKAKGTYNDSKKIFPAIDAKMNLKNGYLLSGDYSEPVENIHLISEAINKTGNFSDTKLNLQTLTYTLEGEPFDVSGTISDLENYIYDLKIKGLVDLDKVTKIYPVEGLKLSGIIDTDIKTSGRLTDIEAGRYDKTSSEGTVELKEMRISGESVPAPIRIKDALFSFTPTKIVLKKMDGKIGKGTLNLTGDLYNYMSFLVPNGELIKGDLNLVCDTLDLNLIMAKKKIVKETNDTIHSIALWEVPRNIDFVFDSYINVLKYEDILIKRLKGEIKIKDGMLSLNETGFNSLNARFKINGDYNTKNIKHPFFDLDIDIKELDIHKAYTEIKLIRDIAPAVADAYGIFSITYKLKGELNKKMSPKTETLTGEGEIRIAEAQINGMKIFEEISKTAKKKQINDPHLKDLIIKTEIRDNQLFVKPFSMTISGFDAEVEGVNDIKGTIKYIVRMELLSIDKIKIPFHVTGTYDNPKVAIGKGHKLPD